jgi:uracil-DNA glycosylase
MRDLSFLAPGWRREVGEEFEKPYFEEIRHFLRAEYRAQKIIYPPKDLIFSSFRDVDFDEVKAVILGQDPYHGPGQAMGRSFAVPQGLATPPSLRNIFLEVASDMGVPPQKDTSLSGWVEQGVLLLNTLLTVRAGEAFSHRNKGWETFTDRVIAQLGKRPKPMVFLLWGSPAQQKAKLISGAQHAILKAPHPSPLSAHRGFLGSRIFSQANAFLQQQGQIPIDWSHTASYQPEKSALGKKASPVMAQSVEKD